MNDEQRLQMITEQLIIVRDNLLRGMSKSIQKLQAREINKVLGLAPYVKSNEEAKQEQDDLTIAYMSGYYDGKKKKREWVDLTHEELDKLWLEWHDALCLDHITWARAVLEAAKEKNT